MHRTSGIFSLRNLHAAACGAAIVFISWGLLSSDPLAVVKRSPLSFLTRISDLIMHCSAYCVLATVCLLPTAFRPDQRAPVVISSLLALHAIGTELLQAYIPRRTCDPMDALANLTGIALGAIMMAWLVRPRVSQSV